MDEFDEGTMAAAQRTAETASEPEYDAPEEPPSLRAQVDAYGMLLQELLVERALETDHPAAAIDQFAARIGERLFALDAEDGEEHAHIREFLRAARERVE